jgi:hypothetical protein
MIIKITQKYLKIYAFHPSTTTPKPIFLISSPLLTYDYPVINSYIVYYPLDASFNFI